MRLFVWHKKSGEIVSVAKANVLPKGLDHPYADVGEDEAVLEVQPTAELEQLDPHEIAERFTVDVQAERLKPRGEVAPSGRARRRKGST